MLKALFQTVPVSVIALRELAMIISELDADISQEKRNMLADDAHQIVEELMGDYSYIAYPKEPVPPSLFQRCVYAVRKVLP